MITKRINGHEFEFYDSIDSLPISQFHLYSKHILVLSGIGDSIESIDNHIGKIASLIKSDPSRAVRELLNYRKNLYAIISEDDFRHKGNLCLVKRVDGKDWTDFSSEGIDKLYSMVTTETEREMRDIEVKIKAKLDEELMLYFPEIFDSSVEKNYNNLLRKRALLQLAEIIDRVDNGAAIRALDQTILRLSDSHNFEGKESAEIEFDRQFEKMCLTISREFGGMVKGYTVMEFYTANRMLSDEQERMSKTRKNR